MTAPTPPTLAALRSWLKVTTAAISDADLQTVLDGETAAQTKVCTVDPYTADLYMGLLRRCGRSVSARGVPLGLAGSADTEYGPVRLPTFDAEIERLEGPYRKVVFA